MKLHNQLQRLVPKTKKVLKWSRYRAAVGIFSNLTFKKLELNIIATARNIAMIHYCWENFTASSFCLT